jgi:hypothetical protein
MNIVNIQKLLSVCSIIVYNKDACLSIITFSLLNRFIK